MRTTRPGPVSCGIDIGSTNIKVVALDPDGHVVARTSQPTPREGVGLNTDASVLVDVVENLILQACGDLYQVHALCSVGVGEDGLLLDAQLRPLTTALAWFDPIRTEIWRDLRLRFPAHSDQSDLLDDPFDVADGPEQTLVGWAWARNQPGSAAAASWVAIADLPAVLWTGRPFLSDTLASRTGAWRARTRTWSATRVETCLGTPELLPAVLAAGTIVGTVGAGVRPDRTGPAHFQEARSAVGAGRLAGAVAADAIVVAGGHDHPVGGWGVDLYASGAVLDSMGTAEVVVTQAQQGPGSGRRVTDVAPGIRSAGTTRLQVVDLSRNVAWAARDAEVGRWIQLYLDRRETPDLEVLVNADYFEPSHVGAISPAYTTNAPRDPRIKAAAVLGALARAGRSAVDAVSGGDVDAASVHFAGGWTRSPGWLDIKAAVYGYRAVPIAQPEVTAVGAALLAAAARGWQPDPAIALGFA